ncbi:NACHT domain-containing NTPase [Crocosphaera sp. XPORK-15E]|uniref:NACHT domain-containing protein n=1 Tax=Crocosphaera sp. XPORK-15E TaxID=3110247 RepID=UPI002B220B14|nr:NACHT domain-containing NTPase [Crocosphaera sp. XPORK-15E]MEA5534823.1 NACHT domain-containing NTPase [Crocosphaera sp. XPORK-15E]
MTRRSLQSSAEGIMEAKQALANKGWTQEYLAGEVGLSSRQSIWKFLTGRPVERQVFKELCFKLDLNWEEIANLSDELPISPPLRVVEGNLAIEELVEVMRSQIRESVEIQCNALQSSFELTQPPLKKVYTTTNFLLEPSYQRWLEVSDLHKSLVPSEGFRLSAIQSDTVGGLELVAKRDKLVILGKPGAGKTTFLQYLALQCNQGRYRQDLIPCFIQLRSVWDQGNEEPINFLNYFVAQGKSYGLSNQQTLNLLQEGKFLCLFDGLDEVPQPMRESLCKNIESFTKEFYKNPVIITSRSSAQQFHFRGFTYVEMADFNHQQLKLFVNKWFGAVIDNKIEGKNKAQQFLDQLEKPENQPIRELAITPILLNLLCSVFKESGSFPRQRTKLYQAGLDILLQRWDQARGIERDSFYQALSVRHKMTLLSQIAATTFAANRYFFESRDILGIIENYLTENFGFKEDLETLWLTSEAVLKSIELQHGILVERAKDVYSFSHLTFHEYFTARKILANDRQNLEIELTQLADKILDYRWQEVILLTISMLPKADVMIKKMKDFIDNLAKKDLDLQEFLENLDRKVKSMKLPYNEEAVRAFYFTLFRHRDLNLALSLDTRFGKKEQLSQEIKLDSTLTRAFMDSLNLLDNPTAKNFLNLCFTLELEQKFSLESKFLAEFKQLKLKLPNPDQGKEAIVNWVKNQGKQWVEMFRDILIQYRQIGYDWQLNQQQKELWNSYYDANLFLVECLQGDCHISVKVKKHIESTLLLPA